MSKTKTGTFEVEIEERRVTGSTNMDKEIVLYLQGLTSRVYLGAGDRDEKFQVNMSLRENI